VAGDIHTRKSHGAQPARVDSLDPDVLYDPVAGSRTETGHVLTPGELGFVQRETETLHYARREYMRVFHPKVIGAANLRGVQVGVGVGQQIAQPRRDPASVNGVLVGDLVVHTLHVVVHMPRIAGEGEQESVVGGQGVGTGQIRRRNVSVLNLQRGGVQPAGGDDITGKRTPRGRTANGE